MATQQAYAQSVGTIATSSAWIDQRDPTPNDIYYLIGQFWINQTATRLWYLNSQSNASGTLQSDWELAGVSSTLASISDTSNVPVFASSESASPPNNIQLVGGEGISIVSTPSSNLLTISTIHDQIFPWTDESSNFNAQPNNGYFCTASLTVSLPSSPSQGDVIKILSDTTGMVMIQANTGQYIRIGNVIGSAAGNAINTRQGDAIDFVYRAASTTWYAYDGVVGTWGVS